MTERTNLPGRIVDLVRDGVAGEPHRRQVFGGLVSSAQSAQQHGWSYAEWHGFVLDDDSRLGQQARRRYDKTLGGYVLAPKARVAGDCARAWKAAAANIAASPAVAADWTPDEADLEELASVVAAHDLNADQRAVMAYAIAESRRRQTRTPALPRRRVATACGITEQEARNALAELAALGYLPIHEKGAGCIGCKATTYRLPTAAEVALPLYDRALPLGGAAIGGAAPTQREEPAMQITITASGPDPDAVAALLRSVVAADPSAAQKIVDAVPALRLVASGESE